MTISTGPRESGMKICSKNRLLVRRPACLLRRRGHRDTRLSARSSESGDHTSHGTRSPRHRHTRKEEPGGLSRAGACELVVFYSESPTLVDNHSTQGSLGPFRGQMSGIGSGTLKR